MEDKPSIVMELNADSDQEEDGHVFRDLREFIDFLDSQSELLRINGADWELEIGGLTQLAVHNRPSPALLFDEIVDHEPGFRVLTNSVGTPFRWSAAAGLPPVPDKHEAILLQKERSIFGEMEFYQPETVSEGPILENIQREDDVDVTIFPAPKWNEQDGGRYLGTGDMVITKHATTEELNAGTYRVCTYGEDMVLSHISPGKDGRINLESFLEAGEPAPIVICVGQPADAFIASCEKTASHLDELAYLGGLRNEPVEVIEGEITGIPFPAHAEIVLEGYVYPEDEPVPEGPFGEWTGYYSGGSHKEEEHRVPPIRIEQVYYRDDPIIFGIPPIRPPSDVYSEIRNAARIWNELDEAGIPNIVAVNSMPFGPGWFEVIAIDQAYGGHATQVALQEASGRAGGYHGRFTVVVDDDVDVYDQDEVLWAVCSRCDPKEDIQILTDCWSTSLDPRIPPERKRKGDFTNTRAILDATRPFYWKDDYPDVNELSEETIMNIKQKFSQYFGEDGELSSGNLSATH